MILCAWLWSSYWLSSYLYFLYVYMLFMYNVYVDLLCVAYKKFYISLIVEHNTLLYFVWYQNVEGKSRFFNCLWILKLDFLMENRHSHCYNINKILYVCVCLCIYFIGRLTASLSRFFSFLLPHFTKVTPVILLGFFYDFLWLFFGSFLDGFLCGTTHNNNNTKLVNNTALNFYRFFQELLFNEQWIIQFFFLLWLLLLYKSRFPTTSSSVRFCFF